MTKGAPVLAVKHLSVDYQSDSGTVHAVTDVSFTLHRGEILGIAGESGCGKSTLVYAITQLLHPLAEITSGELIYHSAPFRGEEGNGTRNDTESTRNDAEYSVRSRVLPRTSRVIPRSGFPSVNGEESIDLLQLNPRQLRAMRWSELAIVFQSAMNALNPVMTIGTQIMDVLSAHRPRMNAAKRQAKAAELLRLVGIAPERLRSYPHELSGGMRQRAAIAIALTLLPPIIIMDEPTTALDVVVQREILDEILRLRDQLQFALIFITHDLSLLLEIADSIAIMYAGRIVERGQQSDLFHHPRHPYSYGLLNAFPSLTGEQRAMYGIPGTPPDLRTPPPGCAFHPRCPLAFGACHTELPLLRPVAPGDAQDVACHLYDPRLHPTPPTTEEIAARYLTLTERSVPR
jgi:peptide/nickel transport system ATP-binding protein